MFGNYFSHLKLNKMKIDVDLNETVTISLDTYEGMKSEIKELKDTLTQKTIIKEVFPNWYNMTMLVVGVIACALLMCNIIFIMP